MFESSGVYYQRLVGMLSVLVLCLAAGSVPTAAAASAPDPFPTVYKMTDSSGTGELAAPKTVPMGWNAWNTFKCNVTEAMIKKEADLIVSLGLRDAGYVYVNLDDCWAGGRDRSTGRLIANPTTFPDGIAALATYLNVRGLKLGIYSTPNSVTCAVSFNGYNPSLGVGSGGHESIDAQTFADWGVTYLKYDRCGAGSTPGNFYNPDPTKVYNLFTAMRDALASTKAPIFYSTNLDFGTSALHTDGFSVDKIAHTSRVANDISPNFASLMGIISASQYLEGYAMPGYWNDMDMMEVGNLGALNLDRINLGMWAMMNSPLLIGSDLSKISSSSMAILKNADVIAVGQDPMNTQAVVVNDDGKGHQIWAKPLYFNGQRAVALLNTTSSPASMTVTWSMLHLQPGQAAVRDLWMQADLGQLTNSITVNIPSQDVAVLQITGTEARHRGTNLLGGEDTIYESNSWGPVDVNLGNGGSKTGQGTPLSINGIKYAKGFGVNAPSQIQFRLNDTCSKFTVQVGVDDFINQRAPGSNGHGNVIFQVWGDGRLLAQTATIKPNMPAATLTADVRSASVLRLIARPSDNSNWYDYGDWISPTLTCQ